MLRGLFLPLCGCRRTGLRCSAGSESQRVATLLAACLWGRCAQPACRGCVRHTRPRRRWIVPDSDKVRLQGVWVESCCSRDASVEWPPHREGLCDDVCKGNLPSKTGCRRPVSCLAKRRRRPAKECRAAACSRSRGSWKLWIRRGRCDETTRRR